LGLIIFDTARNDFMITKKLFILITVLILQLSYGLAQVSEIECTVYRRSGVYITLTPVHFDQSMLPHVGESVYLFLYVKSNLPEGKAQGYYQLFLMETVKINTDINSIVFKAREGLETAKLKTGLPDLILTKGSQVKIAWQR
jgi:hypothetical protein